MAVDLQYLINEAQMLSPQEQVELINAVSQFLQRNQQSAFTTDFWQPTTLDQLVEAQNVEPVNNVEQLVFDEWPADETADDINDYIYEQRQADRLRSA